ncbi:hypothetical protein ACIQAA_32295, partial [Neobacillus sp. NPDC093182]|uniref:hypothetical protein n=1 Tax=Neobacillus sp. NPDC093182 TaxID=3364297 RepID=UPI00382AC2DC
LTSFTRKSNYKGYEILRISEHSRDIRIKLRELKKKQFVLWCGEKEYPLLKRTIRSIRFFNLRAAFIEEPAAIIGGILLYQLHNSPIFN